MGLMSAMADSSARANSQHYTYHSTKGSPTECKGVRKRCPVQPERVVTDANALGVKSSCPHDEPGKEEGKGKEGNTGESKEEYKVHPKHPVQGPSN